MVLTRLVGPGSVYVGCPLGSLRCECGGYHYFTILMLIISITMYHHVLPTVVHAVLPWVWKWSGFLVGCQCVLAYLGR